jgi:hypothetical protein
LGLAGALSACAGSAATTPTVSAQAAPVVLFQGTVVSVRPTDVTPYDAARVLATLGETPVATAPRADEVIVQLPNRAIKDVLTADGAAFAPGQSVVFTPSGGLRLAAN